MTDKEIKEAVVTGTFDDLVKSEANKDKTFRTNLLIEGLESFLKGDEATAALLFRDYSNSILGE